MHVHHHLEKIPSDFSVWVVIATEDTSIVACSLLSEIIRDGAARIAVQLTSTIRESGCSAEQRPRHGKPEKIHSSRSALKVGFMTQSYKIILFPKLINFRKVIQKTFP